MLVGFFLSHFYSKSVVNTTAKWEGLESKLEFSLEDKHTWVQQQLLCKVADIKNHAVELTTG